MKKVLKSIWNLNCYRFKYKLTEAKWKLNSHVTDRFNNNFIKKSIQSYLIRDIIFYIQLCYNKHTKLKELPV